MMSSEQSAIVKLVYNRFMESEESSAWNDMDENLCFFDLLSDEEMIKESTIMFESHSKCKTFRCERGHEISECFAPFILECVEYILDLYGETEELHIKNRYILEYYLTMSELKIIYGANEASLV